MPTKTYSAKPGEVERGWYVVDADGETLGRLATRIADTLRGKLKPEYTPHIDTGDFVVVINCERIRVTGKKMDDKIYYRHSGYHGGLREETLRDLLGRRPEEVIRRAVKGMVPRNAARSRAAPEAQGVRRPRAPARGPGAQAARREEVVMAENDAVYRGTGKRKTSVARVILTPGSGAFTVNGRALDEYFGRPTLRTTATSPLELTGLRDRFDVKALCDGGGITGQAGALRHGIARALIEADPELRIALKQKGFLTRDAREVERKKAGLKGARRRPQFSKR